MWFENPTNTLTEEQPGCSTIGKLLKYVKRAAEGLLLLGVPVVKGNLSYNFIPYQDSKDIKNPADLGSIHDSLSLSKMNWNARTPYLSRPHFNHTFFTDLFHITNEGVQRSPWKSFKWLSLSYWHRQPQSNGFAANVCDCVVQLLRLILLSLQSVTVPYLRVLCVEILLPEIIAGPSRYFFSSMTCKLF